jgi:hypothetical protein
MLFPFSEFYNCDGIRTAKSQSTTTLAVHSRTIHQCLLFAPAPPSGGIPVQVGTLISDNSS